jgi:hypothetical protein
MRKPAAFLLTAITVIVGAGVARSPGTALAGLTVGAVSAEVSSDGALLVDDSSDTPIQPGAPKYVHGGTFAVSPWTDPPLSDTLHADVCTMNFVFKDTRPKGRRANTYIGAAGHCALAVGMRDSAPEIGEFGTVVFQRMCNAPATPTLCPEGGPVTDDFSLIRVDSDKLPLVSPVMRGVGAAPSGFTTSDETAAGDVLTTSGWGIPFATLPATRTLNTVLVSDDDEHYAMPFPGTTHSGSPVIRASDGKAVGILTTHIPLVEDLPAPLPGDAGVLVGGSTVEHILALLTESGFNVRLVTGASR